MTARKRLGSATHALCSAAWLLCVGCRERAEPPASRAAPVGPYTAAHAQPNAGGLTWDVVPPLVPRAAKTQLRAAEYGVAGDARSELLVFYFGNEPSGSVDANVQRWLAQIEQPDGSDSARRAKRAALQVSGLTVSTVEVRGVYTGPMALPNAPPGAVPAPAFESSLLGAIVNGPRGPVFFKLTGPTPSVERARDAFERLLRSLRPE